MQSNKLSRTFWLLIFLAASGFTLIFSGVRFNFWGQMGLTAGGLAIFAVLDDPLLRQRLFGSTRKNGDRRRETGGRILAGLVSAVVLYGIFWCGNLLSRQWFGFAGEDISSVYLFKQGAPVWMIWALIILIIGPGEEIFWRGYIQSQLSHRFPKIGWVVAALFYAGVHAAFLNVMLILAALVCGLFWGWLYFRFQSIWMNVISHVVWDVMVFLIFPFQ